MFNNKKILITGGTGSFGKAFVKYFSNKYPKSKISIFSRDEIKQWDLSLKYKDKANIKFIIGDIRDISRVEEAFYGQDYIVHAAATKIVPTAEVNPSECIKTNIIGAMNIIEASKFHKIKNVIALSTDKACNPINLYGATKLASDKLFISANNYDIKNYTKFSVVRYGNVMGSRGSVIPFFVDIKKNNKKIPVTSKEMTRFMVTLNQAVSLVEFSLKASIGGEIFIKKIPSINIMDIVKAIDPDLNIEVIGLRPGEKIHEQMITTDDSLNTYEYKDYYKIIPPTENKNLKNKLIKGGKIVKNNFSYISSTNKNWMTSDQVKNWIKENLDN
jgi:UDP-N-acetylglucosamine 4,6-dehydratase|tara:strand:+ start:1443 stop:2432 length:990 start_codon:yes stop_codon:yes gene_type:complete